MRKILRTAAKVLAVFLWVVKGLLLLAAVGAAVLWPVSCGGPIVVWQVGRPVGVRIARFTAGPASGEYRLYTAECWDGGVVIRREWGDVVGGSELKWVRAEVQDGGEGWGWRRVAIADPLSERDWPSHWGPLRWHFGEDKARVGTFRHRNMAAPLWGVCLAAGAWPLASITLLIRRRRKRRRLARMGCCQQCGYDLRATAVKGGPLLARCPECGAAAAPARGEG